MATVTTSGPQQQVAMPAVDLRRLLAGLIREEGIGLTGDLLVSQRAAGANMSVDVAAGDCYVADDHASGGGFYFARWDAVENVTVGASDPTNPRIDRIVVRVRDAFLADAANDLTLFVVAGTATAGATLANLTGAAAVPSSALLLANVLVAAGGTSIADAAIGNVVVPYKAAGSGANQLYNTTLTAVAASVDITSIPTGYSALELLVYGRSDNASALLDLALRFNNDTAANYDYEDLEVSAATATAAEVFAATAIRAGSVPGSTAGANLFGFTKIVVPHYSGAANNKIAYCSGGSKSGTATTNVRTRVATGHWRSNAAINRITVYPGAGNFDVGTRVTLGGRYG